VRPLILLVPSFAAARELPRRLASSGRPLAGVYGFEVRELARAVAEPALLGRGLGAWNRGHASLLAARLLDGPHGLRLDDRLPRAPVALALARTLVALRTGGVDASRLEEIAARARTAEDRDRLRGLAGLYRDWFAEVESRFADGATVLAAAAQHVADTPWLGDADVLIVDDLELDPAERAFVAALARHRPVRRLEQVPAPGALAASGFASWAEAQGLPVVPWADTLLAPLAPPAAPAALSRLREALFEAPAGAACADDSVELLTAPGEAAEVRGIVRRLLREAARGVAFEEMGVALPRPDTYAPLFTDLLARLGIPFRLHPSLPLTSGRATRALLLLLRCRGLGRPEVMELLTFAPVPFAELLGAGTPTDLAAWDQISRDAGIVSDLARWIVGLRAYAETERREAGEDDWRRARAQERASQAESLLRLVELLSSTLECLAGEATWPEWSDRLQSACDQWIGPEDDRDALTGVVADLAGLSSMAGRASWNQVERVLATRLSWERLPTPPRTSGAIHLGALDAIAGLPFRVLAIPGLVEGGYPGPLRLDPFLLDAEREALAEAPPARPGPVATAPRPSRQLGLFDERPAPSAPAAGAAAAGPRPLPTAQDRLLEARRLFHRAIRQATERLILSYPRADSRSGRERVPSLFFVSAASALQGRPLGAPELAALTHEDDRNTLPLEDALDAGERDLLRVRRGGPEAVLAVAAGSPSFKGSHLSAHDRWSRALTAHDGLVAGLPSALARRLDPLTSTQPVSASSLARYATCGFQYLLANVLRLKAPVEPEERLGLNALEKGSLFHEVAEEFLRAERDAGRLPVTDDDDTRTRLLDLARARVDRMVAGTPPRHRMVWDMHWRAFCDLLLRFLAREAANAALGRPAHFEVAFGLGAQRTNERHGAQPLAVDLGDGRVLRVSGKIDRIDEREDGSLVLRDYKTGRAPRDDNQVFKGGRQLQIPFYVLAAQQLFPEQRVEAAFLDFVDGGRPVAFDPVESTGESFRSLLRTLTSAIAAGRFVQEHTACRFCDFQAACGPQPLLELRRRFKLGDPHLREYLKLREWR
jgi:ATP-dependent helicase/nuclease subunit B